MVSKIALEKAAQAWCKSTTSGTLMDPILAEAFAEIIDEYREALIWCGGSDDFGDGGKAREGWLKVVESLVRQQPVSWSEPGDDAGRGEV